MEQARRLTSTISPESDIQTGEMNARSESQLANKVIVLTPATNNAIMDCVASEPITPAGKWPGLLERVRGAAHYIREVENRSQEQEFRVQELLDQVRADMQEANTKVQDAERRVVEIQTQADKLVRAAEDRASNAQKRALEAEGWLLKISEAIDTEFVVEISYPQKTSLVRG